jgi:hypothetical protein
MNIKNLILIALLALFCQRPAFAQTVTASDANTGEIIQQYIVQAKKIEASQKMNDFVKILKDKNLAKEFNDEVKDLGKRQGTTIKATCKNDCIEYTYKDKKLRYILWLDPSSHGLSEIKE